MREHDSAAWQRRATHESGPIRELRDTWQRRSRKIEAMPLKSGRVQTSTG